MTRSSLTAALAALASMGITTNAQVNDWLLRHTPRSKRRNPHRTTWNLSKYHQPIRRLRLSRGAGSISCKADVIQLCTARRYADARMMVLDHERQCGEVLFPSAWWRNINDVEV